MPKTYVIQISSTYPFQLELQTKIPPNSAIKITRHIESSELTKELVSKVLFTQNLRNKNLIKMEYTKKQQLQRGGGLSIIYEYVRSPEIVMNDEFWEALMPQLQSFTMYLANIGVKAVIKEERVGVNQDGVLKYYLGLQFGLGDQVGEEDLELFYSHQINTLKDKYLLQPNFEQGNLEFTQYNTQPHNIEHADKYRKASLLTLPSKDHPTFSLNKELVRIKNTVKQIAHYHTSNDMKSHNQTRSIQNKQIYASPNKFTYSQLHKEKMISKHWQRKYSDWQGSIMASNRKLSAKYSDFRSDYQGEGRNDVGKTGGYKAKEKMQEIKYQQFIQIANSKKNYLKDFLTVLEDQQLSPKKRQIGSPKKIMEAVPNFNGNEAQMLRFKAQQSIQNSLKVIKKVKGAC